MKKILFILLAALVSGNGKAFSQTVNIEVFPDQILENFYLGNGVQWDAYPLFDISEESWQRVFERTDFMKLNFIRLMVNANEYCKSYPVNGKPVYDFNAERIRKDCRILDYCEKNGVHVLIGEWSPPRFDGLSITDPRWTEMVGEFMNYLLNVKKYTCIRYYNLYNEPNSRDRYSELWKAGTSKNFDDWKVSILNLDKEFRKRGLRDKLKIVGPDCSNGNDWIKRIISDKELCLVIDVYDIHRYARDIEIEDGEFGEEVRYYRNYITRHDPDGKNKQFIMGEAGMTTGKNNVDQQKNIGTFQYGVWMADFVVQSINGGQAGLLAWDMDDAMHTNGKLGPGTEIKDYIWKEWGFWDSFGVEKGSPELTNMRPWYYTWSLMSKYIPRGSQTLKTGESGVKGLRVAASKINRDGRSEYTFLIVNAGNENRTVKLTLSGLKGIDLNQFNYFETDMPKGEKGFPIPKDVLKKANLSKGISIKMPTKGVVILTSLF